MIIFVACFCVAPITPRISEVCAVYDKVNETLQIIETTWNELVWHIPYSTYYLPMMYCLPTPFFCQKLCGRVFINTVSTHC